jgi:hypothetical protein
MSSKPSRVDKPDAGKPEVKAPTFVAEIVSPRPAKVARPDFTEHLWKGKVRVWRCVRCGHNENTRDDIVLHVVAHYPVAERTSALERLMKEK